MYFTLNSFYIKHNLSFLFYTIFHSLLCFSLVFCRPCSVLGVIYLLVDRKPPGSFSPRQKACVYIVHHLVSKLRLSVVKELF
ncbi:hypothetical protein AGOR_G00025830 [Albula goreensis]|uniref:Uncharacterized protein n=1 Tax=Albula goreensis TaxID=1534307 RepID=A0A8T3E5P4_9TELE|nr:hypothetical protein AGOR_G00025830 [Albula goreensis]